MQIPLYKLLAQAVIAYQNCLKRGADHAYWKHNHQVLLERLMREHMPSGSGVDDGTKIDLEKSTGEKLVFITRFHHMNEAGYYTKWTDHVVTVTPSLAFEITVKISGFDYNGIKDHLGDLFYSALKETVDSQAVCS